MKLFTNTNSEQTKYRCLIGSIIALEGLIGAGKSTLGLCLETYLKKIGINARFFPEYVCEPLLDQYIKNMSKYAYSFQIIMLQKRLEIYNQAHQFALAGGISIVDRSLIGDYTFAHMQHTNGYISNLEMNVYMQIMNKENLIEPSVVIYLKCDPQIAYQRMINRGNVGERNGYSLEYFQNLNESYQETIQGSSHTILTIDWNQSRETDSKMATDILDSLR